MTCFRFKPSKFNITCSSFHFDSGAGQQIRIVCDSVQRHSGALILSKNKILKFVIERLRLGHRVSFRWTCINSRQNPFQKAVYANQVAIWLWGKPITLPKHIDRGTRQPIIRGAFTQRARLSRTDYVSGFTVRYKRIFAETLRSFVDIAQQFETFFT